MSDNRKYYYLKLKENYFDDDSIVLLESMQDGVLYSNILLKLYLKSLKHGGRLQLDENIPYTAQMIATITRQQIGTVERALQIFLKLGLVEVLDSGTFYMSNIELLIGQSSTEAERKRAARLQNKALSAPRTKDVYKRQMLLWMLEVGAVKYHFYSDPRHPLPVKLMYWGNVLFPALTLLWAIAGAVLHRIIGFSRYLCGLLAGAVLTAIPIFSIAELEKAYFLSLIHI